MNKDNWKKLFTYFKLHSNILWATKLLGSYDLSIEMEVKDVDEFRRILDSIKEKFSNLITEHESILVIEEQVMRYLPTETYKNR